MLFFIRVVTEYSVELGTPPQSRLRMPPVASKSRKYPPFLLLFLTGLESGCLSFGEGFA